MVKAAFSYISHCPVVLYKLFTHRKLHNALFPQEPLVSALILALNSCSSISYCRAIHARVIKSVDYSDGFIGDQLVSKYVKFGGAEDAHKLFDEMPHMDVVSWNSLISCIGKCLSTLFRMKFEMGMKPNEVTLLSVISACTDFVVLDVGKYYFFIGQIDSIPRRRPFLLSRDVVHARPSDKKV